MSVLNGVQPERETHCTGKSFAPPPGGNVKMIRCRAMLTLLAAVVVPASARATASGAQPIVMFIPWKDPTEGGFTLNVPQGWTVTGGTSRRSNLDVRQVVRMTSPDGRAEVFLGDASLVPNTVPNQMTMMAGLREGQLTQAAWGGATRIARFVSGDAFSRGYAGQTLCRGPVGADTRALPQAQRELEKKAEPLAQSTGLAFRASVGEATFRCGDRIGYVRTATLLSGPAYGQGAAVWDVLELGGYWTTDPASAALARYVLETMIGSLKTDPRWEAAQAKARQDTTGAVLRGQRAMAESIAQRGREMARTSQVDVMSGWLERSKRHDETMKKGSDVRRGTMDVEDSVHGTKTVGNGSDYVWTRSDGSMVGTNTDTPPDYTSGWRRMTVK